MEKPLIDGYKVGVAYNIFCHTGCANVTPEVSKIYYTGCVNVTPEVSNSVRPDVYNLQTGCMKIECESSMDLDLRSVLEQFKKGGLSQPAKSTNTAYNTVSTFNASVHSSIAPF